VPFGKIRLATEGPLIRHLEPGDAPPRARIWSIARLRRS